MTNLRIDWSRVQDFFFRAMMQGWTVEGSVIKPPDMLGYKLARFEEDNLRLTDLWCTGGGGEKSAGTTTIFFGEIPIWVMQYNGWYHEEAIPTVRASLMSAYQGRIFLGGRGRISFSIPESPHIEYRNRVDFNDFERFVGAECVWDKRGSEEKKIGVHRYNGMSLIGK
ncbi:MAG: hypothetical protein Q8L36_02800 [bacterium]|nr:hypothetical protein [bacterium]